MSMVSKTSKRMSEINSAAARTITSTKAEDAAKRLPFDVENIPIYQVKTRIIHDNLGIINV